MTIKTFKEFNKNSLIPMGNFSSLNRDGIFVFPGFCDVHVHFREPGFSYKETIKGGSTAALYGGYTTVFTMPNLKPVPDCLDNLKKQLEIINKDAVIDVLPYASITKGQMGEKLSSLKETAYLVVGFSDDGRGVQSDEMMERAMLEAKSLDKIIVAHCEDNSLLNGGYIHDGEYAKLHGHKGISSKSEYAQIERDLALAKKTGVKYHVCHISTKESVALIRQAKKDGVDVTCETAPHYLVFNDLMLEDLGRFKMNPPIRSEEDRLALIEGICDGTIDMIATDHAPHSEEEKSKGLKDSLNGVVGLETCFPILYTNLVKRGIITLDKLIDLLSINPRKRFDIPFKEDYCVWDLNEKYVIDSNYFHGKGKSSPFDGLEVYGKYIMTIRDDKIIRI